MFARCERPPAAAGSYGECKRPKIPGDSGVRARRNGHFGWPRTNRCGECNIPSSDVDMIQSTSRECSPFNHSLASLLAFGIRALIALLNRQDIDSHVQSMLCPAQEHAMNGTYVAIISAPCHRDVSIHRHTIVRGIEIDPPGARAPCRTPSMRSICAH